jgi:hypothetical protein
MQAEHVRTEAVTVVEIAAVGVVDVRGVVADGVAGGTDAAGMVDTAGATAGEGTSPDLHRQETQPQRAQGITEELSLCDSVLFVFTSGRLDAPKIPTSGKIGQKWGTRFQFASADATRLEAASFQITTAFAH